MPSNYSQSVAKFIGFVFGAYLCSMLISQLKGPSRSVDSQPKSHSAAAAPVVPPAYNETAARSSKLIMAIEKLPPPERARGRRFLKELDLKGWEGTAPDLRQEFGSLFFDHVVIDEVKMAIEVRRNHQLWATLSPETQELYKTLLARAGTLMIDGMLSTSKEEWDGLSTPERIEKCNFVKIYLRALGGTEVEISQYSVFVGNFMNAAPSHVTLKDSVAHFCDRIGHQRKERNLAALNEVVDFSVAGVQLLQAINQASE